MKISLNWIKQFTNINVSTEELITLATERLGGIEGVTDLSKQYDGIVVAKIVSCVKHPNADKLSLCLIDDGGVVKDVARDANNLVQVVCGAPNVREGLLVAWIPPEAIVPASYAQKELFVLEARDLRGEISNGMLASPAELGMSDDHAGILEIDPSEACHPERSDNAAEAPGSFDRAQNDNTVKLGTPFKNLYDLDDTVLEIENKMFTHRPDGFGQLGVAREIAGIQHTAFKSPDWYLNPVLPSEGSSNVEVTIEDPELSSRYMAVEFENVQIKKSPPWLQSYLKRVGMKPINNVVDITNYIMMLTAQPVHAFDFDKVAEDSKASITIRKPRSGEKMTLLGGKEITPHKDATLICNPDGPIALGGVMGGGNSEIDENTTQVVLECATFNMYNVRKTSMIHGLFTDAATRLTKGQPAEQLPSVLAIAINMFEEFTGAKVVGNVVDEYPAKKVNSYIEVESKFINERLGSKFTDEEIVTLLTNVEFEAHVASGPISVTAPFWRTDIEIPEDIVEEVGRLYGFNRLPIELPQRSIAPVSPEPQRALKQEIRQALSRAGANEVLTYSFVHGDLLKKAGQDPGRAFAIRNALSPDLQYYRLSMLPSLLDKVHPNIKAGYQEFVLFEIGKTHDKLSIDEKTKLPYEFNYLEMVYAGARPTNGAAYYQMLRYVDSLLNALGISYRLEQPDEAVIKDPNRKIQAEKPFDLSRSAYIFYKNAEQGGLIGIVGELESPVVQSFKLTQYTAAAVFELDGASFEIKNRRQDNYQSLSKYPSTEQDITLRVKDELPYDTLHKLVEELLEESDYVYSLKPVSIYQKKEQTATSRELNQEASDLFKNITFRVTLSHHERTLTTLEVNELVEKLTWQANQTLGAEQV